MPYQQSKRMKKYISKRSYNAPTNRWQLYGAAGRQLYKDVRTLKNLINVEFKNHDVEITQTDLDVTADIQALNYVNQGDGTESRDGSMFRMKSLELRFDIRATDSLTTPVACRVILFLDTDPDGSTPTLASLLDDTTNPHISPRNLDSRSRYVIIYDRLLPVNPNGNERIIRKIYKKLDYKVLCTGSTATAANMKKNALYSCFLSSQASGATYKPAYMMHSRIRYIDN